MQTELTLIKVTLILPMIHKGKIGSKFKKFQRVKLGVRKSFLEQLPGSCFVVESKYGQSMRKSTDVTRSKNCSKKCNENKQKLRSSTQTILLFANFFLNMHFLELTSFHPDKKQ